GSGKQEDGMRMKILCAVAALAAVIAISGSTAEAAITPSLVQVVTITGAANCGGFATCYEFRYHAVLDTLQDANSTGAPPPVGGTTPTGPTDPGNAFKDYFTIYDFAGLIGAAPPLINQPAGWTFQFASTVTTPSTTTPSDDPNL